MTADGSVENGGFLHVSGLRYTINTAIPSTVQQDDKGVWTGGPTGAYRVTNVEVLNNETGAYEPLDLTAQYNLAGYNYTLRDLGDGFAMFDGAVNVLDYVSEDYMVLANYVESFPVDEATGLPTIPADSQYAEVTGNGRITIVNEPVAEEPVETTGYTDVSEANWYYEAVTYVTENSLMDGETETTFAPAAAVTGEALTAALNAVSSAEAAADGETITREALAVLLWTRAGSPEAETDLSAFADARHCQRRKPDRCGLGCGPGPAPGQRRRHSGSGRRRHPGPGRHCGHASAPGRPRRGSSRRGDHRGPGCLMSTWGAAPFRLSKSLVRLFSQPENAVTFHRSAV